MSSIFIHRVEAIALRHMARLAQIAALPPQLTRGEFNFWDLNRRGYPHDTAWPRRGRDAGPGLVDDRPLPEPRPRDEPRAVACPRRRSFAITVGNFNLPAQQMIASSSSAISTPFKIVAVDMDPLSGGSSSQSPSWNLVIGPDEFNHAILSNLPSGEKLWQEEKPGFGEFPSQRFIGRRFSPSGQTTASSAAQGGPYQAGNRIILVLYPDSTTVSTLQFQVIVTIEECPIADQDGDFGRPPPRVGAPPPPGTALPPPDWTEIF